MIWVKLLPFLVLAIAPIVATRWLCASLDRLRERTGASDGVFGLSRAARWMAVALWVSWLTGVLTLDPWRGLAQSLSWNRFVAAALHNGLTVLAPALVAAICEIIAFPAVQRARGWDVTWREASLDALIGRLWLTLPAALWWTGFQTMPQNGEPQRVIPLICVVGGLVTLFGIQIFWMRRRLRATFVPHAVTVGTLRDRAFALAAKAGVDLNQIYLFPMARWRLANAFASQEKNLLLTDWLLRHLSTREVDAVIAHELAHMKRGHVSKLSWVGVPLWVGPMLWFQLSPSKVSATFFDLAWIALWILATWHITLFVSSLISRRYEHQADLDSLPISEDPVALMTALVRLNRLNAVPHELDRVDEQLSTHPSTRKRLQAIAQAAGLPDSEVQKALNTAAQVEPAHYELPENVEAATHGQGPIFDTRKRHGISSRFTWIYLLVVGALPLLLSWAAVSIAEPDSRWPIYTLGGVFYLGAIFVLTDRAGRRAQAKLQPALAKRLGSQLGAMQSTAVFVGFSPGDAIRIYEGCYHWDLGFLATTADRLCYVGEQTKFALRRDQIRHLGVVPGAPRWSKTRVIQLDWVVEGREGSCLLSCASEHSFHQDARACERLVDSMRQWWRSTATDNPEQGGMPGTDFQANAAPPSASEVTGKPLSSTRGTGQFILGLVLVLVPVMGMAGAVKLDELDLATVAYAVLLPMAGHIFAAIPSWRDRPREQSIRDHGSGGTMNDETLSRAKA